MTHYNKKVYGLTGGIATGKSSVARLLKLRVHNIVDADKIAHQIILKGRPGYDKILSEFGNSILSEDREINRKLLGNIVFNDEKKLKTLNQITHPLVMDEIKSSIDRAREKDGLVFVDIPLLFELGKEIETYEIHLDKVILVYTDKKTQLERLIIRDKISKKDARARINSQMDIEIKSSLADYLIDNRGDELNLAKEVDSLLKELKK